MAGEVKNWEWAKECIVGGGIGVSTKVFKLKTVDETMSYSILVGGAKA